MRFRALLVREGLRGWCVHPKGITGNPDFAFLHHHVAIFVDSCFWHGCPKHVRHPKSNIQYWRKKIESNRARDANQTRKLRKEGWTVLRIWEHDLSNGEKIFRRLKRCL